MKNADKVITKLRELYPFLDQEQIAVNALPRDDQWLIFFGKEGHEEAFTLPGDFLTTCVEQGFCLLYREECTQALGRLMQAVRSFKTSAAKVVAKLKQLVPELADPGIIVAVSEDDPAWSFFMTRHGTSRPVEFLLPMEVIESCLEGGECGELKRAALTAYHCLIGE